MLSLICEKRISRCDPVIYPLKALKYVYEASVYMYSVKTYRKLFRHIQCDRIIKPTKRQRIDFSHTHSHLSDAGTTQTCCWPSSLFQKTLGASWNWPQWCDWSTWWGARQDLQNKRDKSHKDKPHIPSEASLWFFANRYGLNVELHPDPNNLSEKVSNKYINLLSELLLKSMIMFGTFCSLWGLNVLCGQTRLLVERLWRVWGIFDHLWLLIFFI